MATSIESTNYAPGLEPANLQFTSSGGTPGSLAEIASTVSSISNSLSASLDTKSAATEQPALSSLQTVLNLLTQLVSSLGGLFNGNTSASSGASSSVSSGASSGESSSVPPGTPATVYSPVSNVDTEPQTGSTLTDSGNVSSTPPGHAAELDTGGELPPMTNTNQRTSSQSPTTKTSKPIDVGTHMKTDGHFLWKPVSDKDGKLAVLIPPELTGQVKSVEIVSADKTKVLAKGKYSGVGNGDREHYRFSKEGGKFPDKCYVMITLKNGSHQFIEIKNTSARYTK